MATGGWRLQSESGGGRAAVAACARPRYQPGLPRRHPPQAVAGAAGDSIRRRHAGLGLWCGNRACLPCMQCPPYVVTPMFVNTVSRLVAGALEHVEVAATVLSDPLHARPDIWRLIVEPHGQSIILKNGLSYYFFNLKQCMRDYCAKKNLIVSENFIDEQIVKLLVDTKSSCTGLPDIVNHVKNWIDSVEKTKQDDYTVIMPINQYYFRGEVNTDRLKIVKITDKKIEESMCPFPNPLKDLYNAKELSESNKTDIFAIVNTRANDKDSAVELAEAMVDQFVYAVKLVDPSAAASSRKNSYNGLLVSYPIYNASKERISVVNKRLNETTGMIQSKEFYDNLNEPWTLLLGFLFDSNPTELQKAIIDALYWYGEVDVHRHTLVSQYLYCLLGLEKLLVPKRKSEKAKAFGKNAAIVFNKSEEHAEFYEQYYKKRNSLVHEGPIMIYQEDVDTLRLRLRQILLELVSNTTKFIDLKSYYNTVHNIEW